MFHADDVNACVDDMSSSENTDNSMNAAPVAERGVK
jgi:hypothetical protein